MLKDLLGEIENKYEVILEFKGTTLIDSKLAAILRLVDEKGSLLKASRSLGIPYSRAWERISKAERILGVKLVKTQRGGVRGGMRLTEIAKKLLNRYFKAEKKLRKFIQVVEPSFSKPVEPDLSIAHSHDPLLSVLIDRLKGKLDIEDACIGSGMALASLSLEEVDVIGIHLYDPITNTYNTPYLKQYWLNDRVNRVGGYLRELVFAFNPEIAPMSLSDVINALLNGQLKLINRNIGSGTRIYLEYLLSKFSRNASFKDVRGFEDIVYTHADVAKAVATGKADVGLTLRYVAELNGLNWVHVVWEKFEYFALKSRFEKSGVKAFIDTLESKWFKDLLGRTPGYKALS